MQKMTAETAAKAVNGILYGSGEFDNVIIDSRKAGEGSLFVALKGEITDGHEYIDRAYDNGASVVLSSRKAFDGRGALIYVPDTLEALKTLSAYYRNQFKINICAVTGSVGKTTTKEFCYAVLNEKYRTMKTEGNYNSTIGLPLTVFNIDSETEAAVLEMGMSNSGEISALSHIAKPKTAVITNIGISHIETLGSRENILKAKLEIEDGLAPDGVMILNGDDSLLWEQKGNLKHKTLFYGIDNPACDFRADNIAKTGIQTEFDVITPDGVYPAKINVIGRHNVLNALAAICAGYVSGVDTASALKGLLNFKNAAMRQNIYEKNGITVFEDCYNASPDSMRAALGVLSSLDGKRKIALLGDMLELGDVSKQMHMQIGQVAAKNADFVIAYGNMARYYVEGGLGSGVPEEQLFFFDNREAAAKALIALAKPGDTILFKASRGMKAEEVIKYFFEGWNN